MTEEISCSHPHRRSVILLFDWRTPESHFIDWPLVWCSCFVTLVCHIRSLRSRLSVICTSSVSSLSRISAAVRSRNRRVFLKRTRFTHLSQDAQHSHKRLNWFPSRWNAFIKLGAFINYTLAGNKVRFEASASSESWGCYVLGSNVNRIFSASSPMQYNSESTCCIWYFLSSPGKSPEIRRLRYI